ncbi:MAG: hypothetical protein D3916_01320 [Candidatus Electrothrix sp. MAN1_4]|nr:hypothetical protein [Candidatus Electrothrix sp. MAN1_4]
MGGRLKKKIVWFRGASVSVSLPALSLIIPNDNEFQSALDNPLLLVYYTLFLSTHLNCKFSS